MMPMPCLAMPHCNQTNNISATACVLLYKAYEPFEPVIGVILIINLCCFQVLAEWLSPTNRATLQPLARALCSFNMEI